MKIFQKDEWRHLGLGMLGLMALGLLAISVSRPHKVEASQSAAKGKILLHAEFNRLDGIMVGSEVKLAGLTVGDVREIRLNPMTMHPILTLSLDEKIAIPEDSSLKILSAGLFGQKYLRLSAGGSMDNLTNGDQIGFTQDSILFDKLLQSVIERAEQKLANPE